MVALLVGRARARRGLELRGATLRGLHLDAARRSPEVADDAAARLPDVDEDKVLLDSAVKSVDGFFTTFFVSPYSRYLARWAARRGLTPNQVTTASLVLGIAVAPRASPPASAGGSSPARCCCRSRSRPTASTASSPATRASSRELGAWLDATFDRAKEYARLRRAGDRRRPRGRPRLGARGRRADAADARATDGLLLARGAAPAGAGPPPAADRAAARRRERGRRGARQAGGQRRKAPLARWGALDTIPGVAWVKRMIAFPIGERFALISITAALWSARTTFVALLAWGGFAALYGARRPRAALARAEALRAPAPRSSWSLPRRRADRPRARAARPAAAGARARAPPASRRSSPRWRSRATAPRTPRRSPSSRWLVVRRRAVGRPRGDEPPALDRARRCCAFGEYAGLLWLGALAGASSSPAAFALLAALALRHYDLVYGLRYRGAPVRSGSASPRAGGTAGSRSRACCSIAGALPAGFYVLAAIIAVRVQRRRDPRLVAGSEARDLPRRQGGRGRMIGMVLAAGAGKRLGSLTEDLPKTLLEVDGDRTILDVALGNFAAVGLEEAVVVTGFAAERIDERLEALSDRYGLSLRTVFNPKALEWNNAYSLWCARDDFARGVLLANGDTVHPSSVEERLLVGPQRRRSRDRARPGQDAGRGGDEGPPDRRGAARRASTRRSTRRRPPASTSA